MLIIAKLFIAAWISTNTLAVIVTWRIVVIGLSTMGTLMNRSHAAKIKHAEATRVALQGHHEKVVGSIFEPKLLSRPIHLALWTANSRLYTAVVAPRDAGVHSLSRSTRSVSSTSSSRTFFFSSWGLSDAL